MQTKNDYFQKKIFEIKENISTVLAYWRFKNHKIVFTNGCFDILHRGHIEYLAKASEMGDALIIGLNSDKSVKKIKGADRPVNNEESRALLLSAMHFVDAVIYFDDETPSELIKFIKPQVLVKGGDYKPEDIVGYDIVTSNGGKVTTIPFIDGYSTTSIIKKINN